MTWLFSDLIRLSRLYAVKYNLNDSGSSLGLIAGHWTGSLRAPLTIRESRLARAASRHRDFTEKLWVSHASSRQSATYYTSPNCPSSLPTSLPPYLPTSLLPYLGNLLAPLRPQRHHPLPICRPGQECRGASRESCAQPKQPRLKQCLPLPTRYIPILYLSVCNTPAPSLTATAPCCRGRVTVTKRGADIGGGVPGGRSRQQRCLSFTAGLASASLASGRGSSTPSHHDHA